MEVWVFLGVIAAIPLGLVPARIAGQKGLGAFGYYLFGVFFFVPAVILAWALPANQEVLERDALARKIAKRCPHCDELIRPAANACRHCGRDQ